jgi:hypothetical protein
VEADAASDESTTVPLPRPASQRPRRRFLSPIQSALGGAAIVVLLTGMWLWHLHTQSEAREVLATVPRKAQDALNDGEFQEAAREFARVEAALDRLGRDDSQARAWRQLSRETAALSGLAIVSLHEILEEAAQAVSGEERDRWLELFQRTYRDAWVVIDAPVVRDDDANSGMRFVADFPLAIGDCDGRLHADLPIFERSVPAGAEPTRVIFAGQIESCRLIPGSEPVWEVSLRAETAILWGNVDTFRHLGLPMDGATTKVLAEQARLLGIGL